jgi:Xaa-Pro aminopeptidase
MRDQTESGAVRETSGWALRLEPLLRRAGLDLPLQAVKDLLSGIAQAPEGPVAGEWLPLITDRDDEDLRGALLDAVAQLRHRQPRTPEGPPAARLAALRGELGRHGLAGFVIPRADEHQGEYVAPCAERLKWLTGFSGSAGVAVVLRDGAALFVDGRYTEQARGQVDASLYELRHLTDQPMAEWLARHLSPGDRLGFDPWLHTANQMASLQHGCGRVGARAVALQANPIDRIWRSRPPPPIAPVVVWPEHLAGLSAAEKRRQIGERLQGEGEHAAFLTAPESIAWLLNIRGGDVAFAPLPLGFALIHDDASVDLFMDPRKLTRATLTALGPSVRIAPRERLAPMLDGFGQDHKRIRIDPDGTPLAVGRRLRRAGAALVHGGDPCLLPKATKTAAEQAGIREAHVRDGLALVRFLAWLAADGASLDLTEIAAADRLARFRAQGDLYRGPSFPTISAVGPHGAIVHYRASPETNRRFERGTLYLVDSGAQYLDATTDVTRTLAIGEPSDEMRERFTLVLKGHIAIATARFPRGTTGAQIDALARRALWHRGLDYDHGTGHGVGAYLSVHEGPQRISKLPNRVALVPGMVISNEPGYYKAGAYGIRIENLVLVVEAEAPKGAEHPLLQFETLTLAPFDRTLVERALLTPEERTWVDSYHARVRDTLAPRLEGGTRRWLAAATEPL